MGRLVLAALPLVYGSRPSPARKRVLRLSHFKMVENRKKLTNLFIGVGPFVFWGCSNKVLGCGAFGS